MGEIAVSRNDLGVKRLEREAENAEEECGVVKQGEESSGLMIMWEKLLKRRMLRVLLVEADDSTRQVIAALLRKCSYKVAAVSDGLKAWEVLKGRPHNIDLILTEVDLPAISGFALLTLIMEHEICKNIPVIMMSSHDSISTVYKCMLRGAADYLVKPIRKNELSNLWQHVWRKQTSMDVLNGPQDESVAQQKVEGTCENNTASNHSSGDLACIQRNKELIEKGSDAQVRARVQSLTWKPRVLRLKIWRSMLNRSTAKHISVKKVQENEPCIDLGQIRSGHDSHIIGLALGISNNGDTAATLGRDSDSVYPKARTSNLSEGCDNNNAFVSSSREATDFTFHTYPTYEPKHSPSISETRKVAPSSLLELSLRRSESHSFENEVIEEKNTLVHSNASAFKRYNSRQLQTSPRAGKHQIGNGTESEKNTSYMFNGCNSETSAPSLQRSFSPANAYPEESDIASSQHQHRVFPIAVPVKGIRYNDISQAYGSVLPPAFYTQSGSPLPMPSSVAVARMEPSFAADIFHHSNNEDHNSLKLYEPLVENEMNRNEVTMHRQDHGVETFENRGRVSSATEQSASSGFCNGAISHLNSVAYGSNYGNDSTADQSHAVISYESKTEDLTKYGFSNRSVQREAALTKFRLKRKERCYEKKVRYESRKKLAEQRPRVKGQFVRQVQPDLHPTTEKNGSSHDG